MKLVTALLIIGALLLGCAEDAKVNNDMSSLSCDEVGYLFLYKFDKNSGQELQNILITLESSQDAYIEGLTLLSEEFMILWTVINPSNEIYELLGSLSKYKRLMGSCNDTSSITAFRNQ